MPVTMSRNTEIAPLTWSDLGVSELLAKGTPTLAAAREGLGQNGFDRAIAYAQRGRGERKRLVREGLGNKDIGVRRFISPRTVQTRLTRVHAELGLTSRLQLVRLSLGGGQKT
jgi:hypothetical protein